MEDGSVKARVQVLDDKNVPAETLSRRRLLLTAEEAPIYRLGQAIFFLGDLIKLATASTWFIDSNGKLFTYAKSNRAKLKFHKVEQLLPISSGGVIVAVEGMSNRFKSMYTPEEKPYVGILHFGMALILYGFYEQKYDDTWRSV